MLTVAVYKDYLTTSSMITPRLRERVSELVTRWSQRVLTFSPSSPCSSSLIAWLICMTVVVSFNTIQ